MRINLNLQFLYPKQNSFSDLPMLYIADKLPIFKHIATDKQLRIRTELSNRLVPQEWVDDIKQLCIAERHATQTRKAALNKYRSKADKCYNPDELINLIKAEFPDLLV